MAAINPDLLEELLDAPFKKEDPRPPPTYKNGNSTKQRSPSMSPSRSPAARSTASPASPDAKSRDRKDKDHSRTEKSKDVDRADRDKERKSSSSSKRRDRSRSRDRSSRSVRSSSKDRKDKDRSSKKEKSSRRKRSRSGSREKSSRRKRSRSGSREKSSRRKRSRSASREKSSRRKRSRSRSSSVESDVKARKRSRSAESRAGSVKEKSRRKRSPSGSVEEKRARRSSRSPEPVKQVSEPVAQPPPPAVAAAASSSPPGKRRRSPSVESGKKRRGSPSPVRSGKDARSGSPSRDRRRRYDSPSPDRHRRGGRSPPGGSNRDRDRDRDGDKDRRQEERVERDAPPAIWRPTPPSPNLSEYERNRRTVFVMQLAKGLKNRELAEFFLKAGNVRDVRIISDKNSRRSKGVGYVEFFDEASVPPALQMSGQKLLGVPIIVQPTEAEKNAVAKDTAAEMGEISNKLFVGQLHFSLTEEDIKLVFEPFGPIDFVNIVREPDTGHSRGYGFIQYRNAEDAKRAREKMNSFEIAGRPIKVGLVTDKSMTTSTTSNYHNMNLDDGDTAGLPLTQKGRQELMAKLAREEPRGATRQLAPQPRPAVPIIMPTRCVLLKNMFNPAEESEPGWAKEIEEDVRDECSQFGKVVHAHLDANSEGHVYLKFESVKAAQAAITALNGRFFARRQISAVFVTDAIYNAEFPAAAKL